MRKSLIAAVAALAVIVGGANTVAAQDEPGNIVEIAQGTPELSTLVTAVTEAGLAETLSGPGPFTVFAPTNAAFDALPAGTLDTLLEDPTGDLASILQLHVVSGAVDSEAALEAAGGTVDTLGGPVSVEVVGENLVVGGATVIQADIEASNGIVHVIDAVILPSTADAPTSVDTGDSGLAASAGTSGLLIALLAAVALAGMGGSALVLARSRREG